MNATICYIAQRWYIRTRLGFPLHTAELLGVSSHWPGNDQALRSLISALSVMITAMLLTHSLQNQLLIMPCGLRTPPLHYRSDTHTHNSVPHLFRECWGRTESPSPVLSFLLSLKLQETARPVWMQQKCVCLSHLPTSWDSFLLNGSSRIPLPIRLWCVIVL